MCGTSTNNKEMTQIYFKQSFLKREFIFLHWIRRNKPLFDTSFRFSYIQNLYLKVNPTCCVFSYRWYISHIFKFNNSCNFKTNNLIYKYMHVFQFKIVSGKSHVTQQLRHSTCNWQKTKQYIHYIFAEEKFWKEWQRTDCAIYSHKINRGSNRSSLICQWII